MNVEVLKADKNDTEVTIDNITIAEILRVYLYDNGADFAGWRREHPSKPAVFKIQAGKGVKKAVADAVSAIKKDCDKVLSAVKK
jgi:DNA-directed RNA polymerase subunit L